MIVAFCLVLILPLCLHSLICLTVHALCVQSSKMETSTCVIGAPFKLLPAHELNLLVDGKLYFVALQLTVNYVLLTYQLLIDNLDLCGTEAWVQGVKCRNDMKKDMK